MLADVVSALRCPHCRRGLAMAQRALRCPAGHSFDIARQGYASLLVGGARPPSGDSAAMVAAREAFLGAGHMASVTEAIVEAARAGAAPEDPGCAMEVGAGSAHHLAAMLDGLPGRAGLALDVSKAALRRAARAHPRIGAIACDAWDELPVRSGAVAVALVAFAPRNAAEIARCLAPRGALVLVTPTPRHLAEVREPLGLLAVDPRKAERLEETLGPFFMSAGARTVERRLSLDSAAVAALAAMGPSARHVEPDALAARVDALDEPVAVTASVTVALLRPRAGRRSGPAARRHDPGRRPPRPGRGDDHHRAPLP